LFLSRYIKAHHISRAALIAGGIAAAVVFFVVGAIIRLLIGPVSLGPLGSMLPNALAEALPGVTVRYDEAAIEWSWEQSRMELVILGAKVYDSEGRIIAQAPQAEIDLAAGPLIFHGKAVVQRITLEGVQLTLVRTLTGGLRLGVEKDKSQKDLLSRIADQLSLRNDKSSSLQEFAVRNARIAFYDEPTKLFLVAPDANFRVANSGPDLKATLDADVEVSGHPAHVTGEFTLPPLHGPVKGAVSVTGLDLRALGSDGKTFAGMQQLGLTIDMSASFTMQGARLLDAEFGVGAKGALDLPGLARGPLKIRTAQIDGRYDAASRRILIEDGTLDAEGASAHMLGQADLVYEPDGTLSRIGFDGRLDKIALNMPGVFAAPIALRDVSARGFYLLATRDIVLDHAGIAGGPLSAQASGKITLVPGKTPAIELKGQIAPMGVRDVLRFWPRDVAAGGRDWIDRNAFAGTLGPIAFETHFPAGVLDEPLLPEGALKVTIPINGGEANYIQGLTHVTQLRGVATLTGDTLTAEVQSGRVGPLALSDGHAMISSLHTPGPPGDFKAHATGSLQDVLTLVDKKPLNYPTRFGIDIAQTKGTAALDLDFRLPLRKELRVEDVNIAIKASVSGFAMAMSDRAKLSDGQVTVAIDNTKLHATGTALLADSKLNLDWTEDFRTADPVTTRIAIKGVLDNAGREALNFSSSSFLKGPANVSATLTGHRGKLVSADMALDLTPAALSLDLIGLNKPSGFPTTARIGVTFGPESTIHGETLKLSGPGVTASGSASFDKDGHLTQLAFPQVHFGAIDDFSFTMTRGASGSTDIAVRGRSLDGTRLAGRGSGSSGTGSDTTLDGPFHVDARLDRLMLRGGVAIAPFAVDVSGVGDRPSAMKISGALGKSAIEGEMSPTDSGRKLTFTANDLGLLAKGLFGFSSLRGGKADLTATLPGKAGDSAPNAGPDYQGKLTLSDFKILNQPFLTRLFSAGSLDGLANLMQGQGIAIDKLDVPFSSKNSVIDVKGARATGPAIGFTADGYIDRPKNAIAMKGTLVPLFGLNSVLGKIPVLGDVIVGKEGEGIFGMTYSVHGNADEPDVDVNPLSVLTPGILRRIFQGKIPTSAQAPSNNQPAPAPAPAPPVATQPASPATPKPE
jgi:hypothetical protein